MREGEREGGREGEREMKTGREIRCDFIVAAQRGWDNEGSLL